MRKILVLIFILNFSCIKNEINQNNVVEPDLDKNLTFDEFKKEILKYGKNKKFPDINE